MSENYSLGQVLESLSLLKKEKWIDKILSQVKERVFWNKLDDSNVEEFKEFVRKFTSLYYLMKDKFADVERSSWERYFEHLREVVNNVLDLPNPNTDKILIAIAHDSIEDTNKTFEWLAEDYWLDVALAVESISKMSVDDFMDKSILDETERKKQAKSKRNDAYFWHLTSFATFKKHIKEIAEGKWINLTDERLEQITRNALDVKFADRIHNLTTEWDPNNLEKVKRKLEETKKYFLNIAKEVNQVAYDKIQSLVLVLEIRLHNAGWKVWEVLG